MKTPLNRASSSGRESPASFIPRLAFSGIYDSKSSSKDAGVGAAVDGDMKIAARTEIRRLVSSPCDASPPQSDRSNFGWDIWGGGGNASLSISPMIVGVSPTRSSVSRTTDDLRAARRDQSTTMTFASLKSLSIASEESLK